MVQAIQVLRFHLLELEKVRRYRYYFLVGIGSEPLMRQYGASHRIARTSPSSRQWLSPARAAFDEMLCAALHRIGRRGWVGGWGKSGRGEGKKRKERSATERGSVTSR